MDVNILVAVEDALIAGGVARGLRREGFGTELCEDAGSVVRQLQHGSFNALLLDLSFDAGAWDILDRVRTLAEPPAVLVLGAQDVRSAVQAIRRGAVDYIEYPLDLQVLVSRLITTLETATVRRRLAVLARAATASEPVVASEQMRRVLALADRVALTPGSSALILGESGVGKEGVASRIHRHSRRAKGPFVRVNVAALPDSMIEAELFGAVRGAYTGASRDRPGLFASADNGTLLLDELCELRVDLQAKLLRALEERSFYPVGSDRERSVDVRVIASTNRDPRRAIEEGRLREDLYYRLATMTIEIPPLRERTADIVPLAEHFLSHFSREFRCHQPSLSGDAEQALLAHSWPGNVRELRNAVERAVMMREGESVEPEALGLAPDHKAITSERRIPAELGSLRVARQAALESAEKARLSQALHASGRNPSRAAEMLGISRSTFYEKMKRYGVA